MGMIFHDPRISGNLNVLEGCHQNAWIPVIRGLLIFGSYARGDQRPTSDVDVLAIVKEGAWRDVEEHDGQMFEMVYASIDLAKDFYSKNPNDAVQQWTDGKIIYDPDGVMQKLKEFIFAIRDKGREPLSEKQLDQTKKVVGLLFGA